MIRSACLIVMTAAVTPALAHEQGGPDPAALAALFDAAERAHSSCLVVWQDGKPVAENWFTGEPRKIEAMSATKSVVNLAIGRLVTEGRIKSIDQKVGEFFPEWRQGRKQEIAVRHLLAHTSGLQNYPRTDVEVYPSPDFVRLALAAELTAPPGAEFSYNNKAVNLLAGIVERASGRKLDEYLGEALFAPMGITDFTWTRDEADNPHGMSGLQILPADFAKLGQLVLQRGEWEGGRLIAPEWFDESFKTGHESQPNCGLLWWLISEREERIVDDGFIARLEAASVDEGFVNKMRSMRGRYPVAEYRKRLEETLGPTWIDEINRHLKPSLRPRTELGPVVGYAARGYLGQYLLVFPEPKLVVVRMYDTADNADQQAVNFDEFESLALALWRRPLAAGPSAAPGVSGPLGSRTNPIRCDYPEGERAYLDRLRCADGSIPRYSRQGSTGKGPYGNMLDHYIVICGGQRNEVFMDMYHKDFVETAAVSGFAIVPP